MTGLKASAPFARINERCLCTVYSLWGKKLIKTIRDHCSNKFILLSLCHIIPIFSLLTLKTIHMKGHNDYNYRGILPASQGSAQSKLMTVLLTIALFGFLILQLNLVSHANNRVHEKHPASLEINFLDENTETH